MTNITLELIKKIISERFAKKEFTTGDVYYAIEPSFNKSKFGTVRNILVKLSKEGFISYNLKIRGTPHLDSDQKTYGAVYMLNR